VKRKSHLQAVFATIRWRELQAMRFQVRDIVLSAPGWVSGVYVIAGIAAERSKNPYYGVNLSTRKVYHLSEESLEPQRVGVADEAFLQRQGVTDFPPPPREEITGDDKALEEKYQRGVRRAKLEAARATGTNKQRWEILAAARPGDQILLQLHGELKAVTFHYVVEREGNYAFVAANPKGSRYRYSLEAIDVV
jgi:hypothetical protein